MKNQPRLTLEGLPIVSTETLEIFKRDLQIRGNKNPKGILYTQSLLEEIKQENPLIYDYIQLMKRNKVYQDESLVGLYTLLKNQSEINNLEKSSE